jgi:hypothetical protein
LVLTFINLLLALPLGDRQPFYPCVGEHFFHPCWVLPRGAASTDEPIFLVQLALVIPIIPFDHGDFRVCKCGYPADNVVVRTGLLELGDEILHGDAAGRKLQAAAAIDDLNVIVHGSSWRITYQSSRSGAERCEWRWWNFPQVPG